MSSLVVYRRYIRSPRLPVLPPLGVPLALPNPPHPPRYSCRPLLRLGRPFQHSLHAPAPLPPPPSTPPPAQPPSHLHPMSSLIPYQVLMPHPRPTASSLQASTSKPRSCPATSFLPPHSCRISKKAKHINSLPTSHTGYGHGPV